MRFLHTADWHLGRCFFSVSLIDDQASVLQQLVDFTRDINPDAVVIAADVFDRAVPPTEAVKLLDEIICQLILDGKVVVILIAGNHESPLRSHFSARWSELTALQASYTRTEREYGVIGKIADVANGKNPLKLTFHRLVLSAFLDDVLADATQRLQLMSRGRYILQRAQVPTDLRRASGLDLVVSDTHTGDSTRPVETLSGGETFCSHSPTGAGHRAGLPHD